MILESSGIFRAENFMFRWGMAHDVRPGAARARSYAQQSLCFGHYWLYRTPAKVCVPQNVVITGCVYRRMLDFDAVQGSLRWFLFDERGHFSAGKALNVPEHIIAASKALLEADSPYVRTLRHAVQTAGPLRFDIHLDQAVAGREVAAVVNPYNMHEVRCRRTVVAHKANLRPDIVDILSPLCEPLQYPLLFPFGDAGWSYGSSQLYKHYRCRLLNELRFLRFGRLTSPCLGTVTSDSKECYCPQLSTMHNDEIVDTPSLLSLPAHCLLIVCNEASVPLTALCCRIACMYMATVESVRVTAVSIVLVFYSHLL